MIGDIAAGAREVVPKIAAGLGWLGKNVQQTVQEAGAEYRGSQQRFAAAKTPAERMQALQPTPQELARAENIASGATGGIEASELEPWQMTRAEFHQGKNLHGSAVPPSEAKHIFDKTGFFTTAEESHADFYANSPEKNEVPNAGDIYAVEKPKKPLDLVSNPKSAAPIADSMQREAQRLEDDYLDGRINNNPAGFGRAVKELQQHVAQNDPRVRNALANADAEYNKFRTGSFIEGDSLTRRLVKNQGYDAVLTKETNQATKLPADVTIYVDRPSSVVSHRQAVAQALEEGKPVPAKVLADYPDLANQQFVYQGTRQMGTEGEKNLASIKQRGVMAGQFSVAPHEDYGPPWIAVKKSDLPSADQYISRFGPAKLRGTPFYTPDYSKGAISADKVYLADSQGNIIGPLIKGAKAGAR